MAGFPRFTPAFQLLAGLMILLAAWQLAFWLGIFDRFLFPSPFDIILALAKMLASLEVVPDLINTVSKIAVAAATGSAIGFGIGVGLFFAPPLYDALSPLLDFFRSIPATALFPLFLLFFGIGDPTSIALATWVCALYLSLHVSKGLRGTSEAGVLMAKTLKKTEWEILYNVRLREAMPMIFAGFRTAVSLTVVVVVVTEMFVGTRSGIGKVLIDAAYSYSIPKLYAGIVLIGIIGYALNQLVILSEQKIVHWQGK